MYGYQDYPMYGATPQMQERLSRMEQTYRTPPLRGRVVTGIEEARASQISLDGTPSFFPSPSEGKIYEKAIDLNGMPVFKVYALSAVPKPQPSMANPDDFSALVQKVNSLEMALAKLEGEMHHESNADDGNAATVK